MLAKSVSEVELRSFDQIKNISSRVQAAQKYVVSGGPLPVEFRKQQLRNLYYAIIDHKELLHQALFEDLHRCGTHTDLLELGGVLSEIVTAIKKLDRWVRPKKTDFDLKFYAASPKLVPEPYGLVLVIGPWNYPYLCSLAPLVCAIAAGNCVVLKPSEMAPHAAEVMLQVLETALDPHVFTGVHGGIEETTELLTHKFDKICFTGSPNVGQIVSLAAAKHLTPCLLELGGKCPTIVDNTCDLALAAKRIVWGKFVNAGQTCIAPDYIIVEKSIHAEFVKLLNAAVEDQYPNLTSKSGEFAHIVSPRLWNRANELVNATQGVSYQHGDKPDKETLYFPPTVVDDVDPRDTLMQQELFGPILPVVTVNSAQDSIDLIRTYHDTPLAMYIFSSNKRLISKLRVVRSGAIVVNDVLVHGGSPTIPFGGIGKSGDGAYHGKFGFDAFSHHRPILTQPSYVERFMNFRYTPFTQNKRKMLDKMTMPGASFPRQGPVNSNFWDRIFC